MKHDPTTPAEGPQGPALTSRERVYRLLEQAPLDNLEVLVCELVLTRLASDRPLGVRERGELARLWAKHMEKR